MLTAQQVFHSVNSGTDRKYRGYHEENLKARSAEAKCPFVVVNAVRDQASSKELNCASGIVNDFAYVTQLPRTGVHVIVVDVVLRPSRGEKQSLQKRNNRSGN